MKYALFLVTLIISAAITHTTYAYRVTDTNVVEINQTTSLYTISFTMGFLNRDTLVPIAANSTYNRDISFQFLDKNDKVLDITSHGILLSDAVIKDNQYYIPAGKTASFTLITLPIDNSNKQKSLNITELPFTLIEKSLVLKASVPADSLKDFKTPLSQ